MPPLEVWEKVLVDPEILAEDVHGYIACTTCHAGENVDDKEAAHVGLIEDPSVDAVAACGDCHIDIAPYQEDSLHNNLAGYDTVVYERATPENHPAIEEGESYHCNDCHTTCGQCHISQPTYVGDGLINGHEYNRVPSMSRQCTACHGSRVNDEYTGAHEGYSADVHLRSARMVCTDCHSGGDMHGTMHINSEEGQHDHRYDGEQNPTCESCHEDQSGIGSGNEYHDAHGTELLSCQTCHSTAYINCYGCHLERTEDDRPFFRLEHEDLQFVIGRNPRRTPDRPYRYVPVRHAPVFPEIFELYGENVLDNFNALPTWGYATPHNIQRNTPQTESCEACHGNDTYFLTEDKVEPEFIEANIDVIVPFAPPLPEQYEYVPGGDNSPPDAEAGSDPLDASADDPLDAPADDPLDAPADDPLDAPADDPLDAPADDPLDAPAP